jgi:membrane protein
MAQASDRPHRGREADDPRRIPSSGWKDIAYRVKDQVSRDNVSIVSAGVAFYLLLSIVPALAAAVAIYGLFSDPQAIARHVDALGGFLPGQAQELIRDQLTRLSETAGQALGIGALVGILVSVWSATRAMVAMMAALNIAYDEEERRGFVKLNLIALGLTVALVLFLAVALTLVAVIPVVLDIVGITGAAAVAVHLLRWPVLAVFLLLALAVLYRFAPDREEARWAWVSPGAIVGGLLWLLGSIGFSLYVSFSDTYEATYGSLGAVVVMMMWLFVSAFAIMLGAEWNAETERQTRRDTTTGRPEPMGRRDARAADAVAQRREEPDPRS